MVLFTLSIFDHFQSYSNTFNRI